MSIPEISEKQLLSMSERLVRRDSHLVWKGARKRTDGGDVGILNVRKKRVYVHRVVWELYVGSTDGIALKRTCKMNMCCEPQHMKIRYRKRVK